MAKIEAWLSCDLKKPVQVQGLSGNVFSMDNNGSRINVRIYDNGEKTTVSGSVTANCILADGSTINVNGSLTTDNGQSVAYVDIPQSCLLVPGPIRIAIKLTASGVITTLAAVVTTVYRTQTDIVITPSAQIIQDWNAEISAAIATQNAAIANQDTKINDLKSAINSDMRYKFPNDLTIGNIWEQGGWTAITTNPTANNMSSRIRTVVPFNATSKIRINRAKSGYDFIYAIYDSNNTLIVGTTDWISASTQHDLPAGSYTIYLAFRKSDNSSINPSEIIDTGITIIVDGSFYGFPDSFFDTVAKKQDLDNLNALFSIESARAGNYDGEIVDILGITGGVSCIKTLTGLSGLIYDGSKFVAANASYNSIVFKVIKGQYITIKANSGTIGSIRSFSKEPVLNGTSSFDILPNSYTFYYAQETKYIVCTFTLSGGIPSIDVFFSDTTEGIGKKESTGTYNNSNLSNLLWDGAKYVSGNASFNSFLVCLNKGEYFSWTVTNGTQQTARVFTATPVLNANASMIQQLSSNAYFCSIDRCYLLISFNLTSNTTASISYTRSAINLWNYAEKGLPLHGKKIMCLGDSITEVVDDTTKKTYADYFSALALNTVICGGIGGTRMAQRTTPATPDNPTPANGDQAYAALDLSNLAKAWINNEWTVVDAANTYLIDLVSDDNTAIINNLKNNPLSGIDIVTIMIGGNDVSGGTVIGNYDSTSDSEYCGAFNNIVNALIAAKPSIKIYIFTNIVKYFGNVFDDAHWSDNYENSTTHVSLPSLNETIENLAKRQHLACGDMYWTLGWNKTSFLNYLNPLMNDGSHPTHNEGLKIIAERMYSFISANKE